MGVPKTIGRYEIVEELGRGAMGSVFKAKDPAVGRIVALKTIHTTALEGAQSEEYRTRFYREARASGVLAHPGIVPVFDVGEDQGAPFLVMEFVEGRTLADAIKKGERFTLDRVCEIGQQIADALGYAHRQGVIHRDIKPANILMTSKEVYGSERPRITDFGIAKLASSDITTTGQLLGTPSFMPPEQFTGSPIDGRADLFSLGVILYSLATGEQPFPGETMTAVSYKVVYTEPIPPAKLNPAVPARVESVILKCLAKSPADRYQTGEELAQDLATVRTSPASLMQTAAPLSESDATLGPGPISQGPVSASLRPAPVIKADKSANPQGQKPAASAKPGAAKPGKPKQFEHVFGLGLLAVAGVGVVVAGGWYWIAHRKPPAPPPTQTFTVQPPVQQQPQVPKEVEPLPAEPQKPAVAPVVPPPAASKNSKPPAAKPASSKTTPPPPQPVASVTPPAPAKPAVTPPAPAAAKTPTPAPVAVPAAFDPRKPDPNKDGKLKIDVSKFPKGLPFTISMNKQPYLHFITGDGTNLDNLYAPPGMQQFQVTFKSGGQEWTSKPVSSDFKAKKTKTMKVQLFDGDNPVSKISVPIAKDALLAISFSSSLTNIF
ncbi:MAG TPA: serine/threonine-protein kinase [Terracidiphilus sp.]|jgi:serine/threonine-protein kinase